MDLDLLGLRGAVLMDLHEWLGARAAFEAYLQAGATGANAREARRIVQDLTPVLTTFLEVTVDNARATGPVEIYLNAQSGTPLCSVAPTCRHAMIPGVHSLIAVAGPPGFEPWTGDITVQTGTTTRLRIALAQKPSRFTATVTPPDARVEIDGAPYGGAIALAAGKHRVVVSRAGYVEQQHEVAASAGRPVALAVTLVPVERAVQPSPEPAGLSPATALLLSVGGTVASWGVVAAAALQPQDSRAMWTLGAIGAAGTLLGPSLGHWYARSMGSPGLIPRALGGAVLIGAGECFQDGSLDCKSAGLALGILGGILYAGGTVEDVVTAQRTARSYRPTAPRASPSTGVTVVPIRHGDRNGLAIAGWF